MAGIFSAESLERVRAASDIVEVVGAFFPLKKAGANFVALCPFHREKTPSFNVSPHKQVFHCYGCHKGGDVFKFVQEYENVDFPEAVRRLADRAKIALEYERGSVPDSQARHFKEQLFQIHEAITQRWQIALENDASGQIAREYLARRQVSEAAVKLFRIGFAPEDWEDTVKWARGKGYELEIVEKAGLILKRDRAEGYYDRFRGRLMFPICDEQGRVIGFSGRILTDEKTAKYVNSPETPIFTKSKVFFGLDKTKRAILEADTAIVCEGQLDLIACFMSGVQNVVAPQGTAFTADHGRILKRYAKEVILCFDADAAGQNAAVRSLDHLLAAELAVRVAVIPAPHDPDSFIKAFGGPAFKELIAKAEGFFDYYLARLATENDVTTDRGRLSVLRGMSETLAKTRNNVLVDTYARKTALRLGVQPEAVLAEFRKAPPSKAVATGPSAPPEPEIAAAETPPSKPELWLLRLLLAQEELAGWASCYLDVRWIRHPGIREVIERRLEAHSAGTWTSLSALLQQLRSPGLESLVTEAVADSRPVPNPDKQIQDIVLKLRNAFIDAEMGLLLREMSTPDLAEEEKSRLGIRREQLRAQKSQALRPLAEDF
jgi:DNA primase